MAEALVSLEKMNQDLRPGVRSDAEPMATTISDQIGVYSRGGDVFDLSILQLEDGLPASLLRDMAEDIEIYEAACARVHSKEDEFVLPGFSTHDGNMISYGSRRFIESVAFELETRGKLNAYEFGYYSAFCSLRDRVLGRGVDRSLIEDLVEQQFEYDASEFEGSPFLDLAMAVQAELLVEPIWGLIGDQAINIPATRAADLLQDGIAKLTPLQWTQFALMNGMHHSGLFLPLAQVIGLNPWETYMEWKTQNFAPDSEEEQSLRMETSIIRSLGDFGSN